MIRFLNFLQGIISLVFVVLAALLGWPVWVSVIGIILPLALSLVIIALRAETPKGRAREVIEMLCGFIIGVGGILIWALAPVEASLGSSTPWWSVFAALPSVLFNLGLYIAIVFYFLRLVCNWGQKIFEFFGGERVPFDGGE